jgi:hypothetical protein
VSDFSATMTTTERGIKALISWTISNPSIILIAFIVLILVHSSLCAMCCHYQVSYHLLTPGFEEPAIK